MSLFQLDPPALYIDLIPSLQSLAANEHVHDDMLKLPADLDRYRRIIEITRPDVIVETGTYHGGSARWFRALGPDVVTVDLSPPGDLGDGIITIEGDSTDPDVVATVAVLGAGRRCMVSLDSAHDTAHVTREIYRYGPLVTPGCYLVVEDGIFGYAPQKLRAQHGLADMVGDPLEAIADTLVGTRKWIRDTSVEQMTQITHHPAGFWIKAVD